MTEASHIVGLIFGEGSEEPDCPACAGFGLVGCDTDALALCLECGGSGFGNVFAPEAAEGFALALLRGRQEFGDGSL
ncbi:MAG: hypothetical protein NVS2B16_26870 [Chloroflexota bacterium]